MLFLNVWVAFFVHRATRYLRHATLKGGLPRKCRIDKIVFLQQSRRKCSTTLIGQSPPKYLFIYMKSFIKQFKKDEIVIGSAIVVFTFIVEFTRFVIHN
jgi:hypothetical protein